MKFILTFFLFTNFSNILFHFFQAIRMQPKERIGQAILTWNIWINCPVSGEHHVFLVSLPIIFIFSFFTISIPPIISIHLDYLLLV